MAVTFLPIQQGSGDPSPTNVRPLVAPLNITGIGEIWGGSFDVRTGVVTTEWAKKTFVGSADENWGIELYDEGIYRAVMDKSRFSDTGIPQNRSPMMLNYFKNTGSVAIWDSFIGSTGNFLCFLPTDYDTAVKWRAYLSEHNLEICYKLATSITHTLTPAQYAEACQQLHIPNPATELLMQRTVIGNPHIETATGSIAAFNTDMKAPLKQLKCEFAPVQNLNGYSNPWPAGGGKNLCDGIAYSCAINNSIAYVRSLTPITSPHSTTTTYAGVGFITQVKAGVTYALSSDVSGTESTFFCALYDTLNETTNRANAKQPVRSNVFTPNSDGYLVFLRYSTASGTSVTWSYAQCEEGSTATSYEPYENVCPISGWTGANMSKIGINIWDEEWELGNISNSTGENSDSNSSIRSVNYIAVTPNTTYYCAFPATKNESPMELKILSYDADKHYITYSWRSDNYRTYTTSNDTYYIRFVTITAYGTTYNNDISINYPSTDTDYHAYTGSTYAISFPATKNLWGGTKLATDICNAVPQAILDTTNKTVSYHINDVVDGQIFTQGVTFKPNTRYTFILTFSNTALPRTNMGVIYTDGTKNYVPTSITGKQTVAFVTAANKTVAGICAYASSDRTVIYYDETGLFEGINGKHFIEVYDKQYSGYFDVARGVFVADSAIVDLGGLSWSRDTENEFYTMGLEERNVNSGTPTYYCESYGWIGVVSGNGKTIQQGNNKCAVYKGSDARFYVTDSRYTTTADFTAAVDGVFLVYQLKTPIEYPLTPQLLKSLKGTNTIFTDLNGPTTVKYWTH